MCKNDTGSRYLETDITESAMGHLLESFYQLKITPLTDIVTPVRLLSVDKPVVYIHILRIISSLLHSLYEAAGKFSG